MKMFRAQNQRILMYFHLLNSKITIKMTDQLLLWRYSDVIFQNFQSFHTSQLNRTFPRCFMFSFFRISGFGVLLKCKICYIKMPRKCVNLVNNFCYICGEITFSSQKRNLTPLVKTAYHHYFGMKVGDQNKSWAPHIRCNSCSVILREWLKNKK